MSNGSTSPMPIATLEQLAEHADYSLLGSLQCDPDATESGDDYNPRQVFSGHYVPVKPTPLANPQYVAHSKSLFQELGLDDALASTEAFSQMFSGNLSKLPNTLRPYGWATGYALSIFGTEYTQQCPFQTGNGYGDGRAISVLEAVIDGKRWEMQLKGAGRTPYCRGGDGRAVLRSSVREFLAQEHMHALGIPTSRSLCLFQSTTELVHRPWYREGSESDDPDIMVANPTAISTRVAPSFIRVGQLELFARRARSNAHPAAMQELELILQHLIAREYSDAIDQQQRFTDQLLHLAFEFRERLTSLVTHWLRVGYCQGNFNSDNCAAGGYTLDYGPFGFCEAFDPVYQPWTGGGRHFSLFNQPMAAEKNFTSFCSTLAPVLQSTPEAMEKLNDIQVGFSSVMENKLQAMWATKLGLQSFDNDLFVQLMRLMARTPVDFTMFYRELSQIPTELSSLEVSFYRPANSDSRMDWQQWFDRWTDLMNQNPARDTLSAQMKAVNPKYTWREWRIVPAYQQAAQGDYSLIEELQALLTQPYDEQGSQQEAHHYQKRPEEYLWSGGVSHYSCSS